MGGCGSGSWSRWGRKATTDEVKRIDIRFLKKQGWLIPGVHGKLSWSCGGQPSGSVNYQVKPDELILNYAYRTSGEEWSPFTETVQLDKTPCHYGGYRQWFLCPHCRRRVVVLYGAGIRFLCRKCNILTYASQNEDALSRMMRKSGKVRSQLEGLDSDGFISKPKGMHWKTFNRLVAENDSINRACERELWDKLQSF